MVSVSRLRDDLTEGLQGHIRRVYPLIQGPQRWGPLVGQRDIYFNNPDRFNLVQEPLLEAIPQYADGENSEPKDMANWKTIDGSNLSKNQQQRMEILGSILQKSGVNYNLYPHQKESVLAHLEGRDVVVATGTGSGKTESFLFPTLNHLIEEAIRCDGTPSDRAVKVMVLYPMNALVADQMSRMRDLFGDPKIATILQNKGYGRFPQFGMYTGRAPFHGWYANPKDDENGNTFWSRDKTDTKMDKYLSPFLESKKDGSLWDSLRDKGKVPSVGGKVCFAANGEPLEETLKFAQLPANVQRNLLQKPNREGHTPEQVRDSRFVINQEEEIFDRLKKRDGNVGEIPDHLRYIGDGLDRELIARHQMHLGGVRQYIKSKFPKAPLNNVMENLGVGIPDILVTNYSMLEYMLMRPMEHIFWHKTTEWLETNEEARLLLVIDEAHLYEGAMGTEFTLLLNRLLSVLLPDVDDMDKARDKIQFIITSASLGTDNEEAKNYAKGLLSLTDDRSEKMWLPDTHLKDFPICPGEDDRITKDIRDNLAKASEDLKNSSPNRDNIEIELMKKIIGNDLVNSIIKETEMLGRNNNLSQEVQRRHRIAKMVEKWPAAHRLRRMLLRRKTLSQIQSKHLAESYEFNGLENPSSEDERLPRRYGIVKHFLFEDSGHSDKAMDLTLDIIAAAHSYGSRLPFLPIRMHLFARGDTRSRICPKCGSIWADGKDRCDCGSLVYELLFDRNCGGAYIRLWWSSPGIQGTTSSSTTPHLDSFDIPARAWNARNRDPDTNEDAYHGILAKVLDDDSNPDDCPIHAKNVLLNIRDGSVIAYDSQKVKGEEFVFIQIACRGGLQRFRWEEMDGYVDPRICLYCNRNYSQNRYTAQFSDTETRGNQFFNELVSNCTGKLDPVPGSKHAHRGRKMLIFSDGRQRAAHLAKELKSSQSVDQGRAMFVHLHNLDWFKKIPEKSRTLAKLYPYLCLMSASSRSNPLSDTESIPSRSRMTHHTNLLLIHLYNEYQTKIGQLTNLPGGQWPIIEEDKAYEKLSKRRLKSSILSDLWFWNKKLKNYSDTEKWREEYKDLAKKIIKSRKNFFSDRDSWSNLTKKNPILHFPKEITQIVEIPEYLSLKNKYGNLPEYNFEKVINTISSLKMTKDNPKQLLIPFARRDWLMDTKEISQIDFAQEVSGKILHELESGAIDSTDFSEKCTYWVRNLQFNDLPNAPPKEIGSLLLKWVADERFGTMTLGLGALKLIDDFSPPRDTHSTMKWEVMKHALPLIFLDQREVKDSNNDFRTTGRAITGDLLGDRNTKFPAKQCKFESYDSYPKSSIKLEQENLLLKLARPLAVAICGPSESGSNKNTTPNDRHPKKDELETSIMEFLQWLCDNNLANNNHSIIRLIGDNNEIFLSADAIVFEPLEINNGTQKKGMFCSICLSRRPPSHIKCEINCVHCSVHSLDVIDLEKNKDKLDNNRALGYLQERLSPWHKLVMEFYQEDKTLAVYRAEEHTAQISEIANEEDGYTKTEIHELMFMDIPIQTIVKDTGTRYQQPPIDILSCTTTMEVGIDLGNLNAVALRTVPPHASNYQQRVGRAGRGSSEVSVCLTWVDNSAYAQEFFRNPEQLVTNPKHPPSLYLDNRKIRQRHMNAILFQRFFKKPNYDPENLTFDGMEPGVGQLLESLGTLEQFIQEKGHYGLDKFLKYLEDLRKGSNETEKKIILAVSKTDNEEFTNWSKQLSHSVQEWKDLAIPEPEEEEEQEE